jgi:uncharacterized membrane protein
MIAFGMQHLAYRDFVTRVVPNLPAWVPDRQVIASVFGLFLIGSGLSIAIGKKDRAAALGLGGTILVSFTLLHLPLVVADPGNGGLWTKAGKALALSGAAFLVAGSLPLPRQNDLSRLMHVLERLIPVSHYFLASFLILCGILHFIYVEYVAGLVPGWIPGHVFWTYFAGVALIAGGAGISLPWTDRLAGVLSALMIFIWVLVLHIPRALADMNDANETTAVFEAIAMTGACLLVATAVPSTSRRPPATDSGPPPDANGGTPCPVPLAFASQKKQPIAS